MPIGTNQTNNLMHLTLDVWKDSIFFNEIEYPSGYFATSILNRTREENTELLEQGALLLNNLTIFQESKLTKAKELLPLIKTQLLSLFELLETIEPFSLINFEDERKTVDTIFDKKHEKSILNSNSKEHNFFLRFALAPVRAVHAILNFVTVGWVFENLYLHNLRQRNETYYAHALHDCFTDEKLLEEIDKAEFLPVEKFTVAPNINSAFVFARHPKDEKK